MILTPPPKYHNIIIVIVIDYGKACNCFQRRADFVSRTRTTEGLFVCFLLWHLMKNIHPLNRPSDCMTYSMNRFSSQRQRSPKWTETIIIIIIIHYKLLTTKSTLNIRLVAVLPGVYTICGTKRARSIPLRAN